MVSPVFTSRSISVTQLVRSGKRNPGHHVSLSSAVLAGTVISVKSLSKFLLIYNQYPNTFLSEPPFSRRCVDFSVLGRVDGILYMSAIL